MGKIGSRGWREWLEVIEEEGDIFLKIFVTRQSNAVALMTVRGPRPIPAGREGLAV
jgi:hypothetical protein